MPYIVNWISLGSVLIINNQKSIMTIILSCSPDNKNIFSHPPLETVLLHCYCYRQSSIECYRAPDAGAPLVHTCTVTTKATESPDWFSWANVCTFSQFFQQWSIQHYMSCLQFLFIFMLTSAKVKITFFFWLCIPNYRIWN